MIASSSLVLFVWLVGSIDDLIGWYVYEQIKSFSVKILQFTNGGGFFYGDDEMRKREKKPGIDVGNSHEYILPELDCFSTMNEI